MSAEQYATLPDELTLREVRVRVAQKGFRTRSLVVVTTLLDAEQYPPEEIALLYRRRWQAELHLRSLKIVLQMDHLRCKTPERVRNEFYTHLLGYNLIRGVMAAAAFQSGRSPWEISFKGTLQTLSQFLPILLSTISSEAWCEALLTAVATHIVGNRPDRFEPRLRQTSPQTLQPPAQTSTQLQTVNHQAVTKVQVPFGSDPVVANKNRSSNHETTSDRCESAPVSIRLSR